NATTPATIKPSTNPISTRTLRRSGSLFGGFEKRKYLIQQADVERIEYMPRRAAHSHCRAFRGDFVEARDEAADARAVQHRDPGKIEDHRPRPSRKLPLNRGHDLLALRTHHQLARERDHHGPRRKRFFLYLHGHAAPVYPTEQLPDRSYSERSKLQ